MRLMQINITFLAFFISVFVFLLSYNAIYAEEDLPEDQQDFLKLNAELSQKWPVITEMKEAPADADEWKDVSGKLDHLMQ